MYAGNYLSSYTEPRCTRAAMSAGDADAVVRWDSCRLDFFGTFLVKQKSTENCHEHYPQFKIINMNGRLYDPVIGRFFSPDKYVANSSFTQDFNRYSYARNCPLMYTDPSGEKIKWWGWLLMGLGIDALGGGAISAFAGATAAGAFGAAVSTAAGAFGAVDGAAGGLISGSYAAYFPFSNAGYELQKYISPIAIKPSLGFGSVNHIGIDASFGMLKGSGYRWHGGASYYWGKNPYGSFSGSETRTGAELSIGPACISGTRFRGAGYDQTTNIISIGDALTNVSYENDMRLGIGKALGMYNADGGDRWRTAAVGMNFGPFSANLNMFTGDPDVDGVMGSRYNHFLKTAGGREYYTGNAALDPSMRAGVLSFGFGPFRFGRNSEAIRHIFQNRCIVCI